MNHRKPQRKLQRKPPSKRAFTGLTGRYEPDDATPVASTIVEPTDAVVLLVAPPTSTKRARKQKKRRPL